MKSVSPYRRASLVIALALSAHLASVTPAAACQAQALDYITPTTLHVAIKPFKKSYARGETVRAKVVVTRPAARDPAGLGIPVERPVSQPASDVNVGIGISVGGAFVPGYGVTNGQGRATIGIKLRSHLPAGTATVRAYAYKERVNTPCVVVEEQGYRTNRKAFRVTSAGSR